jgi:hypothetical protein
MLARERKEPYKTNFFDKFEYDKQAHQICIPQSNRLVLLGCAIYNFT